MTPAEIAARVRKPAKLVAAETALSEAKARREEIGKEIRRLNGLPTGLHLPSNDAALRALDRQQQEIIDRIGPLRREVVDGQRRHGAAVREALMPTLQSMAGRASAVAADLRQALDEIETVVREIEVAHGEPFFVPAIDLSLLMARLARLAA
jgi:hypothetical protein